MITFTKNVIEGEMTESVVFDREEVLSALKEHVTLNTNESLPDGLKLQISKDHKTIGLVSTNTPLSPISTPTKNYMEIADTPTTKKNPKRRQGPIGFNLDGSRRRPQRHLNKESKFLSKTYRTVYTDTLDTLTHPSVVYKAKDVAIRLGCSVRRVQDLGSRIPGRIKLRNGRCYWQKAAVTHWINNGGKAWSKAGKCKQRANYRRKVPASHQIPLQKKQR